MIWLRLQYQRRMNKLLALLLTLAMLLQSVNNVNWQGTGNMTKDNMTVITNYINTNFSASWQLSRVAKSGSTDTTLIDFCTSFSNQLNSLWDPAWNVVVTVASNGDDTDTILYGYAFRDHWMWYNGKKMGRATVGFVIWKDYNCIKWYSLNQNLQTNAYPSSYTDSSAIKTSMTSMMQTADVNQLWLMAKKYVDTFESDAAIKAALGQDIAFSIVMGQSIYNTLYYGRFCAKHYLLNDYRVGQIDYSDDWGMALILQMR